MKTAILRLLPLFGAIALAGCQTITNPFNGQPITAQQVQAAAIVACNFQPTIDTVTNILTNNGQNAQTAEAIAAGICKVIAGGKHVPGQTRKLGAALPTYNGVVIRGTFVR